MAQQRFGLAYYAACTLEELEHFCKSRRLFPQDSSERSHERSKSEYIEALRTADDNYAFRFLDLPAELQNQVYEELLLLREKYADDKIPVIYGYLCPLVYYCYPQVLATCKAINRDATEILYSNTLRIDCFGVRREDLNSTHGSGMQHFFQLPNNSVSKGIQKTWIERFLRCPSIHISIRSCHAWNEDKSSMFHSLLSVLQASNRLRKVTISSAQGYYYKEAPIFEQLYHIARLCALFEVDFQDFYPSKPEAAMSLSNRLQSAGNKEFYRKNFLVRLLHLGVESSRCQVHANLLQLNSSERTELFAVKDVIAHWRRNIEHIEDEQIFALSVEALMQLLDFIFKRTARAQTYAISLQGSAAKSILEYQQVHEERIAALRAEKISLPTLEALHIDKKKLKKAREYWEKDARRGRWHGLGLEDKFSDIEKGVRDLHRSKQRQTQELQDRLEGWPEQHGEEGLAKLFDASNPTNCYS